MIMGCYVRSRVRVVPLPTPLAVRSMVQRARERRLLLHVHGDGNAVERIFRQDLAARSRTVDRCYPSCYGKEVVGGTGFEPVTPAV